MACYPVVTWKNLTDKKADDLRRDFLFTVEYPDPIANVALIHSWARGQLDSGPFEFFRQITVFQRPSLAMRMQHVTQYLVGLRESAFAGADVELAHSLAEEIRLFSELGWVQADLALVELGVLNELDILQLYGVEVVTLRSFARTDKLAVRALEAFYVATRLSDIYGQEICHARGVVKILNSCRRQFLETTERSVGLSNTCQFFVREVWKAVWKVPTWSFDRSDMSPMTQEVDALVEDRATSDSSAVSGRSTPEALASSKSTASTDIDACDCGDEGCLWQTIARAQRRRHEALRLRTDTEEETHAPETHQGACGH
jgi:hypothetical protein